MHRHRVLDHGALHPSHRGQFFNGSVGRLNHRTRFIGAHTLCAPVLAPIGQKHDVKSLKQYCNAAHEIRAWSLLFNSQILARGLRIATPVGARGLPFLKI